jgi:hypothetical protein
MQSEVEEFLTRFYSPSPEFDSNRIMYPFLIKQSLTNAIGFDHPVSVDVVNQIMDSIVDEALQLPPLKPADKLSIMLEVIANAISRAEKGRTRDIQMVQ